MKGSFEKFVEQNRSSFDDRTPSPDVLTRLQKKIGTEEAKQPEKKGVVISFTVIKWAAAACVLLLAGIATWWMNDQLETKEILVATAKTEQSVVVNSTTQEELVTTPAIVQAITGIADNPSASGQMAHQTHNRKQTLFASLSNMESPSVRIAAAMKAYEMKSTDKEIVDVLVKTMNSDPSTNVRLAALEALSKFHREGYVKKQLVGSLTKQKDPMVQIELIQVLTQMKQTSILDELEKMVKDADTNDAVKEKAYSSILTLGS